MSSNLRAVLTKASIALSWAAHHHLTEDDAKECLEVVDAALAEPLKNCEVGTVEEQTERFRKFCFAHTHKNGTDFRCHKNCPAKNYIGGWGIPYCQVRWGQLPYEGEVK